MCKRAGSISTSKRSPWTHKRPTRCMSCSRERGTCGTARATSCSSTRVMHLHIYFGCAAVYAQNATSTTSSDRAYGSIRQHDHECSRNIPDGRVITGVGPGAHHLGG